MEWYEIKAALKYSYYSFKDSWEQTRLISYILCQINSKKKLKQEDIVKFYWQEEEEEKKEENRLSDEELERMKNLAEKFEKQIKKKNNG